MHRRADRARPAPSLFALAIANAATGAAKRALDDMVAIVAGKVPLREATPFATNALFQHDLAVAGTELRAARALMRENAEEIWASAVHGKPVHARTASTSAGCRGVGHRSMRRGG